MAQGGKSIVVIGAGIIGLTSALQLQSALGSNSSITIVARDWPSDENVHYTSPWAGAHGRPFPATSALEIQQQELSKVTDAVLRSQATSEPACGVVFMDGYDYLSCPSEAYTHLRGGYGDAEGLQVLPKQELPKGTNITFGTRYRTWSLNPPVYCAYLLRKFQLRGGKTLRRSLTCAEEAFSLASNVDTVVNCSGFGFGDPAFFPIRGQTCLVSNPCDRTINQLNADGTWTFIIPRPLEGGTIIGGTRESHDWTEHPRPETRERVLALAAKMYPPILGRDGKFHVIRDIVGRRPARISGFRLEAEYMKGPHLKGRKIIHAYGAEGFGYAISWGVAQKVLDLACGGHDSVARPSL
ncbi:hypothetical protein PV08_05564 [Exophiala spinifera]|uniref:FAD dependent oxidoreductase domain-containing protein n=1 Tax=Exophiala spinifera TaxID=91928 RepID=A0A0D2B9D4_9EURO|nr:uncharacterized protein PV08_05564 [Exophiala spinifera]KIW15518.1 hypothetical protein PV08_05564 [Exophiala spinifera]